MRDRTPRPAVRRGVVFAAAAAAFVTLAAVGDARADVRQPDGAVVPAGSSLQSYLTMRGETINAVSDAAVEPQRFVPGCTISFTVILRDTSYANSFGWYNVTAGRAPTDAELYELVPAAGPTAPAAMGGVGFTATLDVGTDPRYLGGEIGFYLRNTPGQVFYTERDYQPDRVTSGGFVHVLMYDSRVTANAFYFAWEDLLNGGDNDFQDLLVQVGNIVCAGGGAPCDTGERGVCAQGVRQCRNGVLTCVRGVGPSPERCDGADNDCNGMIDEGDALCPAGQVCERGSCVPRCVEGGCFAGQTCSPRGSCVETACLAVTCPAGQRCVGGACAGGCDGVRCPHGQACRGGLCVDPCAGLMCDREQVCVEGACQPRCPCRRCGAGQTCGADGRCTDAACGTMSCPAGTYCAAGRCVDSCEGAVCPAGQACAAGACLERAADGGARLDAARRDDAGTDGGDHGCACRGAPARGARARTPGLLALVGALGFVRRRRAA